MPQRHVFVNQPEPLENIKEATARAEPLGLSTNKQVVIDSPREHQKRQRLRRMKHVVIAAARAISTHLQKGGFRYRAAMITLTYRPGQHYEPRDISKLCDHYRAWLRQRGHQFRATWVLELQKRGAPHYHLVIWLPKGLTPPMPDKQGWWKKGMSNCEWARNPVGYLAKYASKGPGSTYDIPHGARLHGVYGCPWHLGWWRAPSWMRQIATRGMKITRKPGGWWYVEQLAHAWRSPWKLVHLARDRLEVAWVGWRGGDVISAWELDMRLAMAKAEG